MSKISVFRDLRSLRKVDAIAEPVSMMHLDALEAGERSEKLRFIPWVLAKHRSSMGRRIYFRLWGSPDWLSDEASAALIGLKAELVTKSMKLNVDDKKDLAFAIAESVELRPELRRRTTRFIYGHKDAPVSGVIVSEAAREIGVKRLLQVARKASSSKTPGTEFKARLRKSTPVAERLYSEVEKLKMIQGFAAIPKTQVQKPEFLRVLARKGQVDIRELSSVYSFLMATVLRNPGMKLHFYHSLRKKYWPRRASTQEATFQELKDLIDLGYIVDLKNHYYSVDYLKAQF